MRNPKKSTSKSTPIILACFVAVCLLASNTLRFFFQADRVTRDRSATRDILLDSPSQVRFAFTNATTTTTSTNATATATTARATHAATNAATNATTATKHTNTSHQEISSSTISDTDEDSFSACILWMDDNHRLEEWLAYHYYLLKLRYVVINIDPWSRTSPKSIIDRWNDNENKYNLNMTIVVMNDKDYVENYTAAMKEIEIARTSIEDAVYELGRAKTNYHRKRQEQFYKACSKHLMEQKRSWTSYHDTDEFVTFSHSFKKANITSQSIQKMEQPGYILYRLNEIKRQMPLDTHLNDTGLSCLFCRRKLMCANELSNEETNSLFPPHSSIFPEGFMNISTDSTDDVRQKIARKLETYRYKFFHSGDGGNGKSFIDLSQPNPKRYIEDEWHDSEEFKGKPHRWSPHMAMRGLCTREDRNRLKSIKKMVKEERFAISHYLGSFESYSFRDDARQGGLRSFEIWKERSNQTLGEYSNVIRPWLRGFVGLVGGPEVASYLLQDAGKFPDDYSLALRKIEFKSTYNFDRNHRSRKNKSAKEKTGKKAEKRRIIHAKDLIRGEKGLGNRREASVLSNHFERR